MQVYGSAQVHGPHAVQAPHARANANVARNERPAAPTSDEVQISAAARLIDQLSDIPEVRADRVAEIRSQIAAGTYETGERLDAALDRLLDEIG